mmetsp:Transcript_22813/g.58297  ORF Transcript_22813/g.58297 Transcript_22813/m.58297 type:complete len:224 (-) Transcript_22813:1796-2467(-)
MQIKKEHPIGIRSLLRSNNACAQEIHPILIEVQVDVFRQSLGQDLPLATHLPGPFTLKIGSSNTQKLVISHRAGAHHLLQAAPQLLGLRHAGVLRFLLSSLAGVLVVVRLRLIMAALAIADGGRPSSCAPLLVTPRHRCLGGLQHCVQSCPILVSAVFVPRLAVRAVVVRDPVQLLRAVAGYRPVKPTYPDDCAFQCNNLADTSELIQLLPMNVLPIVLIVLW